MSEELNTFKYNKNSLQYIKKDKSLVLKKHEKASYKLRYLPSYKVPKYHNQAKPNTFACAVCKAVFPDKSHFDDHTRMHEKERNVKCNVCQKQFLTYDKMKKHLDSHSSQHVTCDICQSVLSNKYVLAQHLLIHSGKKPFECDFCKKTFLRKNCLKLHLLIHTGERPFSCEECHRPFISKDTLKVHQESHAKEKKLTCNVCNKNFLKWRSFTKHIRTHVV